MAEYKLLSYEVLEEPVNAHRSDSLMHNMEELVSSIREVGLIEPIVVEDIGNGKYRIWAGHRRSIACTILQKLDIPSMVYSQGDVALERIQFDENRKRNRLTDAEETRVYLDCYRSRSMGIEQIASYFGVPQSRVQQRLDIACGDPHVYELMQAGKLSVAQAAVISRIDHGGYRLQAIELAIEHEFGGQAIHKWWMEEKRRGVVAGVPDATVPGLVAIPQQFDVGTDLCNLGGEQTPLLESRLYRICNDHYNVVLKGLERVGQIYQIEQAGLLPEYMALVRKAERLMQDGGGIPTNGTIARSD